MNLLRLASTRLALCLTIILVSRPCAAQYGVFREVYTNLTGTTIFSLTNSAIFPNGAQISNIVSSFEAPQNYATNYGQRLRAFVIPPSSGYYTFWIAADNVGNLFLSPNENPASRSLIAYNTQTNTLRQWTKETNQQSAPIFMEGRRRYYLEALMKQGDGPDNLSVGWQQANSSFQLPITASGNLLPFTGATNFSPLVFAQPTNFSTAEGPLPVSFSVLTTNPAPVSYQWQRNSTDVPGATNSVINFAAATLADNGQTFRCILSNIAGVVTSSVATLTVTNDITPPSLASVFNVKGSSQVSVIFSEPVDAFTATNKANYSLNNGLTISTAAPGGDNQTVLLTCTAPVFGTTYTLTVNNVRDLASTPNPIAAASQRTFTPELNGIFKEVYTGLSGSALSGLTNAATFPNQPSFAGLMTTNFEAPSNILDNYGQRLRAYVIPPSNGLYSFWIASDDTSTLFLSPDDNSTNRNPIANANAPGQRVWTAQATQRSTPISLAAGRRYYLEALMKEGTGSDYLAVRWQLPSGTIEEPIPASRLIQVGMTGPVITNQTGATAAVENLPVTFQVQLRNADPLGYQWQRGGANIPGATNASYTIPFPALTDSGASFACAITNILGSVTSSVIPLTVSADVTPPTLSSAQNLGFGTVVLQFSERITIATATNTSNYAINNGVVVTNAALSNDGLSVTLLTTILTPGNSYTVTVSNLRDRAATPNVISAGSQVIFTAASLAGLDIGSPAFPGSVVATNNGGFIVTAGGQDIGGLTDGFFLHSQMWSGNFDVKVKVRSLDLTDLWAKAGLMARETLTTNGVYAASFATPSLTGCFFQYRAATNSSSVNAGSFALNYPSTWLRLKRTGNIFTGYAGYDGMNWSQMGSVALSMSNTVYLGHAVTAHSTNQTVAARFDAIQAVDQGTAGTDIAAAEPPGPSTRRTGLIISEIMYNPTNRSDGLDLEFVEIFNSQSIFEDLSGFRLSGSLDYAFPTNTILPAGSFLVVARNPAHLQSVYGIANVLGPYTNNLPSSGGMIRLRNELDAVLLEVNYDNKAPWPIAAGGAGHSLVLSRPSMGEDQPRAWSASRLIGGSPGTPEFVTSDPLRSVFINEFLAHTDPPDFDSIELYNHSNQPVNVGGCIITDDASTNRFVILAGTTIPARGFLSYTETQLGFRLDAAGETIYLINPDRSAVIDAVRFEAQENGIAMGRWPDGASEFYRLSSRTFGTPNSSPLISSVVINEIMFDPISGLADDEYVEIYNRGITSTNIGGWKLGEAVDFTIPTNTILAAGGYLVVAKNSARLLTNYPGLTAANTLGNYKGTLANSGERLTLTLPDTITTTNAGNVIATNRINIVVDEVTYGTGGRWPALSDGNGSSLERINARANGRLAPNWAASDETAKAPWTTIEVTDTLTNGTTSAGVNALQILMLGEGECLVDKVEVYTNAAFNLITNSDFESGTSGWVFLGDHETSALESGGGFGGGNALHIRAAGRGDTGGNNVRAALTTSLAQGMVATIRAKVRWLSGHPEIILRIRGNYLEATGQLNLPTNLGTPGAVNSRSLANAGPAIYEVAHSPVLPATNQPVVVTARVHDADGLTSVTLNYRLDPATNLLSIPMLDNGTGGDAVAGDGIYSATIPGQDSGALVAFHVFATDASGQAATAMFPNDAPNRECLVRFGEPQIFGSFGTYRLWLTQKNIDAWINRKALNNSQNNAPLDATFVYGGVRAVYNMGTLYSGSPFHSPGYNGPTGSALCDYVMHFPDDDLFLGQSDFVLATIGNIGSDNTMQREQTAFWIARKLGVPFDHRRYIHVVVNGVRRVAGSNAVYEDAQQPNSDLVSQFFPDDSNGDLHKIEDWFEFNDASTRVFNSDATLLNYTTMSGQKYLARYRWNWRKRSVQGSANNYTNFFRLVDAANATASPNYEGSLTNIMDTDAWMKMFAVEHVVGNWDSFSYQRGKNMYGYKPEQGRWRPLPWDIDFCLGLGHGATQNLFTSAGYDPAVSFLYTFPATRRQYIRALEDAVNGPLASANVYPLLDAKYAAFIANGLSATSPNSSLKTYLSDRRNFIQTNLLDTLPQTFAITSNGGADFSTTSNLLVLTGVAGIGVTEIRVNGIARPIQWNSVSNWTVQIPLPTATNALIVQGFDRNGNPLAGTSDSITVNYQGQIPDARGCVIINEIMYHPTIAGAAFVELHNTHPSTAFDLSGWRLDGADFTFSPGSFIAPGGFAVIAEDALVFASTYGLGIPLAGIYNGSLDHGGETLKLIRPGIAPNPDEIIDVVRYDDNLPWPAEADGTGPSLQLIDPTQDNFRVANWTAVNTNQGVALFTPGATNSVFAIRPAFPSVWINEVLPINATGIIDNFGEREPWIELLNSSCNTISLDGFFLTDQFTNLTRWPFPPGATVTPGQFLVIWADGQPGQSTVSQFHTSFRLTNGTASLALVLTNNLGTNVIDHLTFASLTANRSYGSYPDGQAVDRQIFHFTTPGLTNNPASSPVQVKINEWVASNVSPGGFPDPADGRFDDWFELYNVGTNTVDLSGYFLTDDLTVSNKWPIPSGTFLGPKAHLLIWADGQTGQNGFNGDLHASFSLSKSGEDIGLFAPDGTLMDGISFGPELDNVGHGRFPDGANNGFFLMTNATPRTANIYPAINTAPTIAAMTATNISEGSLFTFTVPASDPDAPPQSLSYQLLGIPPVGATINATNGIFSWTPAENQGPGLYTITVRATDNGTPSLSATNIFVVTVNEVNSPPVLAGIPRMSTVPGAAVVFTASAVDNDVPSQGMAYSVDAGAPPGASIGALTGQAIWNVPSDQPAGTYAITVRVTDTGSPSLADSQTVLIDVILPLNLNGISLAPNGDVILQWQSLLDRVYRIQSTDTLTPINWTNRPPDIIGNGSTISVTNPPGSGPERYYRVIQLAP